MQSGFWKTTQPDLLQLVIILLTQFPRWRHPCISPWEYVWKEFPRGIFVLLSRRRRCLDRFGMWLTPPVGMASVCTTSRLNVTNHQEEGEIFAQMPCSWISLWSHQWTHHDIRLLHMDWEGPGRHRRVNHQKEETSAYYYEWVSMSSCKMDLLNISSIVDTILKYECV